jgi:hypothetical protein
MYAVVYKGNVIVGPMEWNRAIFTGSLSKEGVDVTLPRVAPETLPYVINEDSKICLVNENRPEMNPMVEYYYGPIWDITGDIAIANYDVMDSPVEFAKVNFKNQAADVRYKKEISGTKINIQNTEVTIDTTRDGRNIFVQKYSLMGDNETVNWKFPQGWLTLTKSELGSIVAAGASHIQTVFDWEKTINDQIDAATTKEQLLSIQILPVVEEPGQ